MHWRPSVRTISSSPLQVVQAIINSSLISGEDKAHSIPPVLALNHRACFNASGELDRAQDALTLKCTPKHSAATWSSDCTTSSCTTINVHSALVQRDHPLQFWIANGSRIATRALPSSYSQRLFPLPEQPRLASGSAAHKSRDL